MSSTVELVIAGLSGAINKMLVLPARDLYDVDAYVDKEFGDDSDDDNSMFQKCPRYPPLESTDVSESGESSRNDLEHNFRSGVIRGQGFEKGITLDPETDPFAPRVGKTLLWRNVNMTLIGKKDTPDRPLLSDVWGEVPETETTAIMGASGAGKTSLLNILAGRTRTNSRLRVEADVRLNNYTVDPTNITVRQNIAFVAQDDSLQATNTPREAIRFSAKLRLPKTVTEEQLDQLAQRMVNELGLAACADTCVGGALIKGISGGERKRASVGVELVVKPAMVFLDEPTSGLDAFSAVQVCQVLKKVANAGSSVLFTIHQPSSEIFASFDRLILMQKGRVMFQGPVTVIPEHFKQLGYPVPQNYNPADWVIHVAQNNPPQVLMERGFFTKDDRVLEEPFTPQEGQDMLGVTMTGNRSTEDENRHGVWTQCNLLVIREVKFYYRFPIPLYARFGVSITLSILVGIIYWGIGDTDPADRFNLTSQLGAIMILMVFSIIGCAQPAIMFFPEERPIFLREYSTRHYTVLPYFMSRLVIEIIITFIQLLLINIIMYFTCKFRGSFQVYLAASYLLALSSTAMAVTLGVIARGNAKVSQQLLPVVMLPQFVFCGFFVSPKLIPPIMRWLVYVCPLTYAVRIITIEEFMDCGTDFFAVQNCNLLLKNLNANPDDVWWYWIVLVLLFFAFRLLALFLLRRSATVFY